MEALYAKLYNKYEKLKNEKFFDLEQAGRDQEEKFINYVSIAEDLVEKLRTENERLESRINELNEETLSIRSCSDEYEKRLEEECEKTKELLQEVQRLQNLQMERVGNTSLERNTDNVRLKKRNSDHVYLDSPGGAHVGSNDASIGSLRKKPRLEHAVGEPYESNQLTLYMPDNSGEKPSSSEDSMGANFMLQTLMESLVGLKFSSSCEPNRLCLSAVHQSSGYSFSLTWISKAADQEAELLYQVSSLGTIGRVAIDWMKEDISFSLSMFPVFLKRISKVLGQQL